MFRLVYKPDRKISLHSMLHGVYRESDDASFRKNLRTILAVLMAKYCEDDLGFIGSLIIMPEMYENGYVAAKDAVVACSYIGFERVTSKWGKEKGLHCVITARFVQTDMRKQFEGSAYTVQFYF